MIYCHWLPWIRSMLIKNFRHGIIPHYMLIMHKASGAALKGSFRLPSYQVNLMLWWSWRICTFFPLCSFDCEQWDLMLNLSFVLLDDSISEEFSFCGCCNKANWYRPLCLELLRMSLFFSFTVYHKKSTAPKFPFIPFIPYGSANTQ